MRTFDIAPSLNTAICNTYTHRHKKRETQSIKIKILLSFFYMRYNYIDKHTLFPLVNSATSHNITQQHMRAHFKTEYDSTTKAFSTRCQQHFHVRFLVSSECKINLQLFRFKAFLIQIVCKHYVSNNDLSDIIFFNMKMKCIFEVMLCC